MGREQHYVGLHYRTKFQIGATNVTYGEDDYFDGSDQKFQFSHPRTSIKDELSPVQLSLKIQKQKKTHPVLHRSSNVCPTMLCLSY